ncbi:MAG: UDP-N-acetylglucosamine 1-carboxyvinyltransferase [Actinomycetota bacterium]
MDVFRVEGGHRLSGSVAISGAKNSALKLMAASLLVKGRTVLVNVPRISDVFTMCEVLEHLGATVDFEADVLSIDTSGEITTHAPYELVRRMRASINVLGPLLGRYGHARVAMPGGCNIGNRTIEIHERSLELLGARFQFDHGDLEGVTAGLVGTRVVLDLPSRGATENLLTAAVLAKGETVIDNAAREPDIADLAEFLSGMGARIEGAGTSTITIIGVDFLEPTAYRVPSDPIESGTLALAVVASGGEAELLGARPADLEIFLEKLSATGATWEATSGGIRVGASRRPISTDFATLPYPGFPTDLQPQMMAYLATCEGTSIVTENMFESRFLHVHELVRMGADARTEGHHAVVRGVPRLQGAPVRASDLRAGAAIMIAALGAEGTTDIYDIHHIERGYEDLPGKLRRLGAHVERASGSVESDRISVH